MKILAAQHHGRLRSLLGRLRVRLMLLVLLATFPVLGLVIVTALVQREEAVSSAQDEVVRVVRAAAASQREHVEAARQLLLTIAQDREVRRKNREACQALFTNLVSLHKAYANIGAADADGLVFVSSMPSPDPIFVGDRPFFKRVEKAQRFIASDYEVDRVRARATLTVAYPVFDRSMVVVYAALDLAWLNQFAAQSDLPDGSTLTVVDKSRQILLRYPDVEKRWTRMSIDDLPGFRTLLERNREGSDRFRDADGVEYFFAITPLSRTAGIADAWVIASIPAATVFAPAHRLLIQNLLYLGVVSILALGAAWFGGEYFLLAKVRRLVFATQRLTHGDLQARAGMTDDPGELGQLARAFDEMAGALGQRQVELQHLNEELEQRVTARTAELKRSNEELEQFAYVASHDLQEPLRMVVNYMQLLKQRYAEKLDSSAQDFIGFALDGAVRMQRLINDLLAYSRVGTRGKVLEPVSLEHVFERTMANLRVAVEESGAVVTHDPLPRVLGDASQLMQLLQNLLGNAIKFRGEKPPAIHIAAQRQERQWQFSIRDNGIGIRPEDYARVFVIFQRLHGREKYPGTGIGLSICKKIVERHGGQIWLESELRQGTTFFFTLSAAD